MVIIPGNFTKTVNNMYGLLANMSVYYLSEGRPDSRVQPTSVEPEELSHEELDNARFIISTPDSVYSVELET